MSLSGSTFRNAALNSVIILPLVFSLAGCASMNNSFIKDPNSYSVEEKGDCSEFERHKHNFITGESSNSAWKHTHGWFPPIWHQHPLCSKYGTPIKEDQVVAPE